MSVIQFTENYDDLSTDLGYQFKFYCDKCHNGFMSTYKPSVMGTTGSLLRAAGSIFGGVLGSAGSGSYEVQRAVGGKAHDESLHAAVEEIRPMFKNCKRCGKWVCPENCWNDVKGLCNGCAPDIQQELAVAQTEETVNQIHEKLHNVDMTKGLDLEGEAAGTCPKCGGKISGKFCGNCGAEAIARQKCSTCGTMVNTGTKFCPECGGKMAAAKPKCPQCGKEFETPPKFCDDCGHKMN